MGAPLHLGQIPGRRISAAAQPRDHHRPLVRPRHGAGRGHGVAQARQDHHRRPRRHDPGPRVDQRHVRQRREGAQGRPQGRRPHPDRHVDHQDRLRRRRARPATLTETEARSKMAVAANKRQRRAPKSMSGSIEEIPLPDLLQLLSTSRKSGVLVVRSDRHVGKIFFRKGQIYFANIENQFNIGPRKALTRMLSWTQGSFELEPPDESAVLEEMEDSTEALLMEGMRQLDEYQRAAREAARRSSSPIGVPRPLKAQAARAVARGAGRVPGGAGGQDRRRALRPVAADRPRDRRRSWSRCSKKATSSPGRRG